MGIPVGPGLTLFLESWHPTMRHLEIPGYVDPAVLEPGALVECVLDATHQTLTVLRVEPALICAAPDGTELVVLAHTAVLSDEVGPVEPSNPYVCRTCGHLAAQHREVGTDDSGRLAGWLCDSCKCESFRGGKL